MHYRFQVFFFPAYLFVACMGIATFMAGCSSQPTAAIDVSPAPLTSPATLPAPVIKNSFKHKVAVARLSLPAGSKPPPPSWVQATDQAKSRMEAYLQQSQNFMLLQHELLRLPLEKDNLLTLNDESLGADYLITGELRRHELVLPGFLDGWRHSAVARAHTEIQLQIIDAYTQQIVFTQQGQADTTRPITKDHPFDSATAAAMQTQTLTAALDNALPALTNALLQRRWRSQILSAQQGFILVNSGASQGIQVGDLFHVLRDDLAPKSKPPAGPASPLLATLKVVAQAGEKENELSVCELIEGDLPDDDLSRLSVLSAR